MTDQEPKAPDDDACEVDSDAQAQPSGDAEAALQRCSFRVRRNVSMRLDVYLRGRLKRISRTKLQELIESGGVSVNGKQPKSSTPTRQGDVIDVILPPPAIRTIEPEPIELAILYEDEHVVVIDKHANLLVHPARGNLSGTLINGLAYRFQQQQQRIGQPFKAHTTRGIKQGGKGQVNGLSALGAGEFRPGIIHRLDKNTTGCLVVAKTDVAHWRIARQFENRTVLKAYLAVVHGNFDTGGGVIEQPLATHPTIRQAQAVRHDSNGKHSVTLYRVREQYQGYCLLELELKTGRTHQIRVHLSYLGHPVAGDIMYGGVPIGPAQLDDPPHVPGGRTHLNFAQEKTVGVRLEAIAAERSDQGDMIIATPALHAALLGFQHPTQQRPVTFIAPMHAQMATLVGELRKRPADGPVAKSGYHVNLDEVIPK